MYDTITIIVAVLRSSSSRLVTHSATNLLTYANSIAVRRPREVIVWRKCFVRVVGKFHLSFIT